MNGIRKIPWVAAIVVSLGVGQAGALGLGHVEVHSALNEPLDAEILLISAEAREIASLRVQLASPENFQRVGLQRSQLTVPLEFAVGRNQHGQPVIKLTSKTPVRDPFLTVLIDAQWAGGRMLREYSMLLDPPLTAPAVRGTAVATPARVPPPAPREPEARPARLPPVADPSRAAAAQGARPSVPADAADEYGPVAQGETLWTIASQARPSSAVSVNQMMIALYQANPEAFIDNNINLLRRGAVLRIPAVNTVQALSSAEAAQMVAQQHQEWHANRGERTLPRIESAETVPAAPAPRRAPAPRSESRLALLPPPGDPRRSEAAETRPAASAVSPEVAGLRADLDRSLESLVVAEQEARELGERVRELERLQANQERLLALKDSELADIQRRLAALQAGREPTPTPWDGRADTALAVTESAREATDSSVLPGPSVVETPPAWPPRPVATPWYSRPYVLAGGAVLVAVVLALVARRRRSAVVGVPSLFGGSDRASRVLAMPTSTAGVGSGLQEDPLDRLQAALAADPTRLSAHLGLLRYRYEQGDAVNFEADAETMSGYVTDTTAPEWDEVRIMGAEIAAEHPLFRDTSAASVTDVEPEFSDDFDFKDADLKSPIAAEAPEKTSAPFSIDLAGMPQETDVSGVEELVLESDFEPTFQPGLGADEADDSVPEVAEDDRTEPFAAAEAWDTLGGTAGDEDDLGLGEGDDTVATKLDLAREYLDLGDPEGARGLLEEVLKEGHSAQKAEAERLMVQIR